MQNRPPLRVGLLLDSLIQPAWVSSLINSVNASGIAEFALVVLNDSPPRPRRSLLRRVFARRPDLLYRVYTWIDERRFRTDPDPFAPIDVAPRLVEVPILRVQPRQTKFCDYFEPDDVARIRNYRLDVAVRLGFRVLKGEALELARAGVWSFHHGDNLVNRGGPPGFWEVAEARAVTGSILQVLTEQLDNGRVIYRSFSATQPLSVWKNTRSYYWKSAYFVTRKLRDLYEEGDAGLRAESGAYRPYSDRLYKVPSNTEMLRFLPRLVTRYTVEKARDFRRRDQWFIGYKLRPPAAGIPGVPDGTFYNFKRLIPPPDRFWADPFPIMRDGQYHIFLEEFLYATNRAHISVVSLGADGRPGPVRTVLKTDFHLSYPNVFEWGGVTYMIPEAVESGRVLLYRCVDFPTGWELDRVLIDGFAGADPTVTKIGDRWWLFATSSEPGAESWDDELYLFFADSPLGPWTPHRRNPVKSDARSARPAGNIFCAHGKVFRPAQDCSRRYGYGVSIQEIERIDDLTFRETEVARIHPRWQRSLLATHTLNAAGDLTVIDGQWRRRHGSHRLRSE